MSLLSLSLYTASTRRKDHGRIQNIWTGAKRCEKVAWFGVLENEFYMVFFAEFFFEKGTGASSSPTPKSAHDDGTACIPKSELFICCC